jgi:RHS repeat-associated protein
LLGLGKGAEIGASLIIEIDGTPYAPVHDVSGSIIALINQETYRYNAYGKQLQPSFIQNPWGFSGKRYDPETGFINFGRRYYSPEMMKWITPDPIGYEDGLNLYAYVHNNPITHFDKYGLIASRLQNNSPAAASASMWDNFSAGVSHQLNSESFGLVGTDSDDDNRDVGGISYYAGRGAVFAGTLCVPFGWVTKALKGVKYGGKALSVAGRYFCKSGKKVNQVVTSFKNSHRPCGYLGKSGWELKNALFQPIRNAQATINGYTYKRHALDQMQNRGIVPMVVENTIKNGRIFKTRQNTMGFYDPVNKIRVITDSCKEGIITVIRGELP